MTQVLRQAWRGVAQPCPRGTKVLDLATGDGSVLRHLHASRPDLKLFGVDVAASLPAMPKGFKVRAGCAMERLPFANGTFHLVTSQFGFEYGETDQVAAETGRVLAAGGRAAFLVHRGDGPILKRNLARGEAIRWVLGEELLDIVGQTVDMPGAAALSAMRLAALLREAGERFGPSSPALEISEAARAIILGRTAAEQKAVALRVLKARATGELQRIEALQKACVKADARANLLGQLENGGLVPVSTLPVAIGTDQPLGDLIQLRKR